MRAALIFLCCLVLAGCWESTGSLLGGVQAVQPFRPGKLVSSNPGKPGDVSYHEVLTLEKGGSYRVKSANGDSKDTMVVRFVALPGLPNNVFAFEAVLVNKCRPGDICHVVTARSEREYGLVRLTNWGAEVAEPDCDESSAVASLPGVKADEIFGNCSFSYRWSLEKALVGLARQGWKTSLAYKYE